MNLFNLERSIEFINYKQHNIGQFHFNKFHEHLFRVQIFRYNSILFIK